MRIVDKEIIDATHGALFEGEDELLWEMARKVPKEQVIVEIGSWLGKSSVALALGSMAGESALVYCVDPHEKHRDENGAHYGPEDMAGWVYHIQRAGVWAVTRPLAVPSTWCRMLALPPIGLLLVDGAHNVKAVVDDFRVFEELVWMADGRAVFHDSNMQEVQRGIEICLDSGRWEVEKVVNLMTVVRKA